MKLITSIFKLFQIRFYLAKACAEILRKRETLMYNTSIWFFISTHFMITATWTFNTYQLGAIDPPTTMLHTIPVMQSTDNAWMETFRANRHFDFDAVVLWTGLLCFKFHTFYKPGIFLRPSHICDEKAYLYHCNAVNWFRNPFIMQPVNIRS